MKLQTRRQKEAHAANTRLAQWGLTSFIGSFCFYCKFVLVDNLVFQNPPLRQAWERYQQIRLGLGYKNLFQFGIGFDHNIIGNGKGENYTNNIGIFIRKEL